WHVEVAPDLRREPSERKQQHWRGRACAAALPGAHAAQKHLELENASCRLLAADGVQPAAWPDPGAGSARRRPLADGGKPPRPDCPRELPPVISQGLRPRPPTSMT